MRGSQYWHDRLQQSSPQLGFKPRTCCELTVLTTAAWPFQVDHHEILFWKRDNNRILFLPWLTLMIFVNACQLFLNGCGSHHLFSSFRKKLSGFTQTKWYLSLRKKVFYFLESLSLDEENTSDFMQNAVICWFTLIIEITTYSLWSRCFSVNTQFVYRAADWKLDTPDWSGRLRITAKGQVAYIKLEDKVSGMSSSRINLLKNLLQPW